jgi:sarcosine oxidase/L-pipecolate oxidase
MAPSYLVVGAGAFGASTALQLKRSNPYANITLVDRTAFPNPSSASFDLNKIVRSDYHDIFYMKLALEAQELWRMDSLFTPHYNETGMLFAENVGKGIACMANYRLLGKDTGAKLMSVEEACTQFPEFKNANWTGVNHAYFNPLSGWCDGQVLSAVIQAALDLGVVYVETTVESLLLSSSGRCIGVCAQNGREFRASRVVLCAGAMTAKILADTSPDDFSLHVGARLIAAAAVSCTVRVAPDKWPKYRNSPVFANVMPHTSGSFCRSPCQPCAISSAT